MADNSTVPFPRAEHPSTCTESVHASSAPTDEGQTIDDTRNDDPPPSYAESVIPGLCNRFDNFESFMLEMFARTGKNSFIADRKLAALRNDVDHDWRTSSARLQDIRAALDDLHESQRCLFTHHQHQHDKINTLSSENERLSAICESLELRGTEACNAAATSQTLSSLVPTGASTRWGSMTSAMSTVAVTGIAAGVAGLAFQFGRDIVARSKML